MQEIVIVSGLPRSGTSMLMQILEAGGLDIFTDKKRTPDKDNPKGYFEYEPVKSLAKDNSWVGKAKGKALKVVANLLQYLPDNYEYKIIFIHRDLDEIIKSQQKMLRKNLDDYPKEIIPVFKSYVEKALQLIREKSNMQVIEINHKDVIHNTRENVHKIVKFLDINLDIGDMISAVDPDLYRNKC